MVKLLLDDLINKDQAKNKKFDDELKEAVTLVRLTDLQLGSTLIGQELLHYTENSKEHLNFKSDYWQELTRKAGNYTKRKELIQSGEPDKFDQDLINNTLENINLKTQQKEGLWGLIKLRGLDYKKKESATTTICSGELTEAELTLQLHEGVYLIDINMDGPSTKSQNGREFYTNIYGRWNKAGFHTTIGVLLGFPNR